MERPGRAGFLVSTRGKRPLTLAAVPRRREAKKGFEPVEIDERMSQTKPLVSVLVGSRSDWETMRHAVDTLARFGVPHEARVLSAHRTPEAVAEYVRQADAAGVEVFIAAAGGAAHLAGVVAAHTIRPVLGAPMEGWALRGLDALLATVQMPPGIPVATMAVGSGGAKNAAIFAAEILALKYPSIAQKVTDYREGMTRETLQKARNFETGK